MMIELTYTLISAGFFSWLSWDVRKRGMNPWIVPIGVAVIFPVGVPMYLATRPPVVEE